jgi:hypothetical protein
MMPARFQLVVDCKDPELLARFWAAALGYVLEPPPKGSLPGTTGGTTSGFPTVNIWQRPVCRERTDMSLCKL